MGGRVLVVQVHVEDPPAIYRSGYLVAWCLTEVQRLVKLRCSRSSPPSCPITLVVSPSRLDGPVVRPAVLPQTPELLRVPSRLYKPSIPPPIRCSPPFYLFVTGPRRRVNFIANTSPDSHRNTTPGKIDKMGILDFNKKKPGADALAIAQEEAPEFEKVQWTKDPGLRKLYFFAFVLCIASATTGYDG